MTNIAELLKDAPKGMKLYSPLFGEVNFVGIDKQSDYPINVTDCKGNGKSFTEFGVYFADHPDAECLLFPSKDCRTWEGWKLPIEHKFKFWDWIVQNDNGTVSQITKVINDTDEYGEYRAYEHTNGYFAACFENDYHLWTIADAKDGDVLATDNIICIFRKLDKDGYYIISPCIYTVKDGLEIISDENDTIGSCGFKPATKEDRELLFRKMKEVGYEWDADKKELRKIQPHYDIKNFKPKQWVLVRDDDEWEWALTRFSHLSNGSVSLFVCINGASFQQCIPFEDNEKLLGTTNMCDEQYINW